MSKLLQIIRRQWISIALLTVGGLLVTGILMASGAAALAWTNTEAFCISCHEMKNNVYAEYTGTI